MVLAMDTDVARRMWRKLEPIHAMIYFVPEGPEEYEAIGVKGWARGYFSSRAAALGPASPELVTATFFGFNPTLVARAIPSAWEAASPAEILAARYRAVDKALRRMWGDGVVASPEVAEASELARTASAACTLQGRPLYAAHASLPWPDEPHLALWHALALLREFRGDGHLAALVTEGVGSPAALIINSIGGNFPADLLQQTRAWEDDAWSACVEELTADGILVDPSTLTAEGQALRDRVEDATDRNALAPWAHLGDEGCDRLLELGKPLVRQVIDGGGFPLG